LNSKRGVGTLLVGVLCLLKADAASAGKEPVERCDVTHGPHDILEVTEREEAEREEAEREEAEREEAEREEAEREEAEREERERKAEKF
jgi:hypothetical protein